MPSREDYVLRAIAAASRRTSVDIVGERGAGRSHVLGEVRKHFVELRWKVLDVAGVPSLRGNPMSALGFAGLTATTPAEAVAEIARRLTGPRALLTVDDWHQLDDVSAAVLALVVEREGIPIVATRLIAAPVEATLPADAPTVQIEIVPVTIQELREVVRASCGVALDAVTSAALWSKTGGNVALAVARVSDAVHTGGTIEHPGGVALEGELWSGRLSVMVEAVLEDLTVEERDTLELVARFGPVHLGTLAAIAPDSVLRRLERAGHLTLLTDETDSALVAAAPRDVEHVLREGVSASFLLFLTRAVERLQDDHRESPEAQLATLADDELMRELTLRIAADAWRRSPTKRTAARYAASLTALGHPDAALTVVEQGRRSRGGTESGFTLEAVAADAHLDLGQGAVGARSLRTAAERYPGLRERMLARSVTIECLARGTAEVRLEPPQGPVADATGVEVARACAFLDLRRGAVESVERVLPQLLDALPDDDRVHVLACVVDIAQGRTLSAIRVAWQRMEDARRRAQRTRVHDFAYLAVVASVVGGHRVPLDAVVSLLRQTPTVGGRSDVVRGAVAALALPSCGAAARSLLPGEPVEEAGLPGVGRVWWEAANFQCDGHVRQAAELLAGHADEQWAAGAWLSAAFAYLYAAELDPALGAPMLRDRVALVGGDGLSLVRRAVCAIAEDDPTGARTALVELEAIGLLGRAERGWRSLAAHVHARGDHAGASEAGREATRIRTLRAGPPVEPPESMTARERQIVRMLATGMSNSEIARELVVSVRTVESHVHRATRKAGTRVRDVLARATGKRGVA